ncbi:hypothetical protein [Nonlabens xiamenensis]|uniref:hypothetical protein n=1 Tax=Nonlabens xiamenensis TaxID=2341043 RepID=UPI000F61293B|nr:hypothetical protein [Nonlabens xiamenensis]
MNIKPLFLLMIVCMSLLLSCKNDKTIIYESYPNESNSIMITRSEEFKDNKFKTADYLTSDEVYNAMIFEYNVGSTIQATDKYMLKPMLKQYIVDDKSVMELELRTYTFSLDLIDKVTLSKSRNPKISGKLFSNFEVQIQQEDEVTLYRLDEEGYFKKSS